LQFIQIGTQMLFAGQQIWAQVTPMNSLLIVLVICVAGTFGSPMEARILAQKDLMSTIVSSLGLDQVWSTITSLGSSTYLQFIQIGTQMLFAGQQIWAQVTPILNQLKNDLLNHTGDAVTIVAQSIASLNGVLSSGKRELIQKDLISTIISNLGLDQVWSTITGLGSLAYLQLIQIGTQLLFAGQQIWAQVTPILNTLKYDLINHIGDAGTIVAQSIASLNGILSSSGKRDLLSGIVSSLGLGSVWDTITGLGATTYLQFINIGTNLLLQGQQVWAQAQVVLAQLKNDLLNHTGDAVTIVSQSIAQLNQIIG
jgi:hypothetical protein